MTRRSLGSLLVAMSLGLGSCAELVRAPAGAAPANQPRTVRLDPIQAERLQRIMIPLLQSADKPLSPRQVSVAVIDDPDINAASAGGGQFYITTGLLEKSSDAQLRGVMAHEIAHEDLGHVAKAQVLGAGLNIGVVLLEQIFPGSSAVTPIAGTLIARGYGRQEELAADRHGMEILRRAGYSPQVMEQTLRWILSMQGRGGGGFLSTHPAIEDRIAALRNR